MTPSAAISIAVILRKLVSPARATELAIRKSIGCFTPTLVMAQTLPQPRSRIDGIAARHSSIIALQFISNACW